MLVGAAFDSAYLESVGEELKLHYKLNVVLLFKYLALRVECCIKVQPYPFPWNTWVANGGSLALGLRPRQISFPTPVLLDPPEWVQ